MPEARWYEEAFRADYRRVYPHRDLAAARGEVRFLVEHGVAGRVLDLCCGFGRHTLALVERGIDTLGLDLSAELLREAAGLPGGERLAGRLLRGDALQLPFAAGCFDSVVILFSSFGYFGELGDARMLDEVARVLRAGGSVLLDLMNPPRVRSGLCPESQREGDRYSLRERRTLTEGGRCVTKSVELRIDDGPTRRWREEVRLYDYGEMRTLLGQRGMQLTDAWGGYDGSAFSERAERMLLRAIRR
jgi:SAM-dependent methyltransferase